MSIDHNYKINIYYFNNGDKQIILNEINEEEENSLNIYGANNLTIAERQNLEACVKRDISKKVYSFFYDRTYLKRVVFSGLLFLLAYLFLSIVIRDPIPLVDELVISSVLVILLNTNLTKKIKARVKNERVVLLTEDLLPEVNETILEEIREAEDYLYEVKQLSKYDVYQKALNNVVDFNTKLPEDFVRLIVKAQSRSIVKKLDSFKASFDVNNKEKILNSLKDPNYFYFLLQIYK